MSRKKRGHFCWCCRRMRPNERFSGGNHPRHLCRECSHLPADEREYRQCESDLERLLHDGLCVPRKRRAQFNRFLEHPNTRVRDLARGIMAERRRHAEERLPMRDEDEVQGERLERTLSEAREPGAGASDDGGTTTREHDPAQDQGDDDPF